jgi:hypothetical protein
MAFFTARGSFTGSADMLEGERREERRRLEEGCLNRSVRRMFLA